MSTALYRTYRPQKFSEVEGQPSAVNVLVKSLSAGRTAHAYLFSGARGCGKTTVARLMAKALNCESPKDNYEPCCECANCVSIAGGDNLDVIEIDGASNNGVEEIRELKSHVSLAPFNSRYKVYIIDEVHMLSAAAFNALLKTLEEPPEYVVFILATTEPHKIPVTIRSRCQHIPFHRISSADILHRLEFVCENEKLEYENEALWEIARQADGALRDALSLLDQVMSYGKGKILLDDVSALVGGGSVVSLQRWLSAWRIGGEDSFLLLNDMFQRGASPQRTIEELFHITRNLWLAGVFGCECLKNADISKEEYDYVAEECKLWSPDSLERLMLFLAKLLPQARAGMRTDVIVGILMSRRPQIINGEKSIGDVQPQAAVRSVPEPKARAEKSAEHFSALDNNLPKTEVKKAAPESAGAGSHSASSTSANSHTVSPNSAEPHLSEPIPAFSQAGQDELPEQGNFKPLDDEISYKLLSGLKSDDFALFCALLDSVFLYSAEQNKLCVIVRHDYIFHFLSGGRNSLIFIKMIREEFPECKLRIVCGGKRYEYGETNVREQAAKPMAAKNPIDYAPEPAAEIIPFAAPRDDISAERQSSAVYDAAHNAMKFMRGEIVMHRTIKDNKIDDKDNKIDDFDNS